MGGGIRVVVPLLTDVTVVDAIVTVAEFMEELVTAEVYCGITVTVLAGWVM